VSFLASLSPGLLTLPFFPLLLLHATPRGDAELHVSYVRVWRMWGWRTGLTMTNSRPGTLLGLVWTLSQGSTIPSIHLGWNGVVLLRLVNACVSGVVECCNYLVELAPRLSAPIAILRNWSFCLFYVMAELWGSVVVSLLFWGFANQVGASLRLMIASICPFW
jgi:TLC ATP/ADP transporter